MTLPFGVMKTSLVGLPFVVSLVVAAVMAVGLATVGVRSAKLGPVRRHRVAIRLAAPVLVLLAAGAVVNDYFAYLPNVGALIGRRAADQASVRQVDRRLELAAGPQAVTLAASTGTVPATPPTTNRPAALARGSVERVRIPAVRSGFPARPAQVYLPPAWFRTPRPALPVIELLHGTPGAPEDWTRAGGADLTADRYAATHGGLAPIIVMPDPNGSWSADTECVDGTQGRAETYLASDVPAWVIANLGASADRRAWALVGSSEGGYCALDLVLRHPDRWATFVDLSGLDQPTYPGGALRLFGGDRQQLAAHDPRLLLAGLPPGPPIAGWFTAGTADGAVTTSVKEMATMASRRGIDTRLELIPNAHHTWRVFRHGFTDALPWVAQRLGLSPTVDPLTPPPHRHHTTPARRHRHPSGVT